ncbi:hypothetical protein C5N14_19585 [Micromonospora sp. MW-13]|uniref:VOC family protein n=1 Tax=unclassified Micromonospora TaxID=2617518 RepID=UPI000E44C370|nr:MULTISPECIES: VOC family protein [unclassified Micromonospora]MCX4471276.1 hypothetical protein [Micromonospora sp. NBC_01655]RGC67199.1 hypothetical protein C5N14_19585 [Micromonospora sp. MW-13]
MPRRTAERSGAGHHRPRPGRASCPEHCPTCAAAKPEGDAAATELLAAGARLVREPDVEVSWWVLADPEGNEFCAFAPRPRS